MTIYIGNIMIYNVRKMKTISYLHEYQYNNRTERDDFNAAGVCKI